MPTDALSAGVLRRPCTTQPFPGNIIYETHTYPYAAESGIVAEPYLQCDFEQQKEGFDALGGAQIDGFYAVGYLDSAKGVLAFVLSLVSHHGRFDVQLIWSLVGQQRLIVAAAKDLIESVQVESQFHFFLP